MTFQNSLEEVITLIGRDIKNISNPIVTIPAELIQIGGKYTLKLPIKDIFYRIMFTLPSDTFQDEITGELIKHGDLVFRRDSGAKLLSAPTKYEHIQNIESSTWTINHNLGYKPNISIFDSQRIEVNLDIHHLNNNTTIATSEVPFSGTAIAS